MTNLLIDRYQLRVPIACAGMSFVGGPALAAAVTLGGGIGSLGTGYLTPDQLRARIRSVRAITTGVLGVNFTVFHSAEHLDVCVQEAIPIVSFHWEIPPAEVIKRLHGAGIDVWQQIGNAAMAAEAVAAGVDAIVAQGSEAGGHQRGELPIFALVPEVRSTIPASVPILAAGGISTGSALAAALVLGADGGYVGTRFVASTEADAHQRWKEALVESVASDTLLTSTFGPDYPDFNPMRVLRNSATARSTPPLGIHRALVGELVLGETRLNLLAHDFFPPTAESSGDFDELPLLAGQGVGGITDIASVAEIILRMMREARDGLGRLHSILAEDRGSVEQPTRRQETS